MPKLMLLAMETIRSTKKKRRGVCPHRIEDLRMALEMGEEIPPIRVNYMGDGTFTVKDGRHRIGAHQAAGMSQIWAIVENIMRRLRRLRALARTRFCGFIFCHDFFIAQFLADEVVVAQALAYACLCANKLTAAIRNYSHLINTKMCTQAEERYCEDSSNDTILL